MNYSITQYGKELDKSLYTIDEINEVFSSKENDLVLNFPGQYDWNFKTGSNCVFTTGAYCTFETGSSCKFKTDSNCLFNTGSDCKFKTGYNCTILLRDKKKYITFIIKEAGTYEIEDNELIKK